jgi:predicted DNA-binding ribbon-helix-helix protein
MVRTQIQLTEEQSQHVKEIAERENISMSEVIRRVVDDWLLTHRSIPPEERKERALSVIGRFRSGCGDLAENHDAYLAEAYNDDES